VDVIFIDVEGSGDKGRGGNTFDAKIFMLAMLLSSHLVYNFRGQVAADKIQTLITVTQLACDGFKLNANKPSDFKPWLPDLTVL
jgi:hypothetical protein